MTRTIDLNAVTAGYLECALWANTIPCDGDAYPIDPVDEDGNELPGVHDLPAEDCWATLTPEARAEAAQDCADFVASCLEEFGPDIFAGLDDSQIGHDFHLSRNGHGAGFFDRGLGDQGDKLQRAARECGTHGIMALDRDRLTFHG